MKSKALIAIISSFIIAAIIFGIIAIMSSIDSNDTTEQNLPSQSRSGKGDEASLAADYDTVQQGSYVSSSRIAGYSMKADANRLHIYELYDNGHSELVQSISINTRVLPEEDRQQLEKGITTDSYEKICSLIEDFSS